MHFLRSKVTWQAGMCLMNGVEHARIRKTRPKKKYHAVHRDVTQP